jgi:hypothetical protein
MSRLVALAAVCVLGWPLSAAAQRGAAPAASPRQAAPFDLSGYWVSVVSEDWKFRMVTPNKGVFSGLPLNDEGQRVGEAWDPARDEASGEQCRAYGAPAIMRIPGRLNIAWQDDTTLKIETDAGMQTRLLRFGTPAVANAEPSWQGHSVAEWVLAGGARGSGPRYGSLKVVTTNLRSGYVRKNGVPYSEKTVVTEYFDLNTLPNGDQWLTVTTKVEDPVYFTRPFLTSSDFKKLPDATGWNPTPCATK